MVSMYSGLAILGGFVLFDTRLEPSMHLFLDLLDEADTLVFCNSF